MKITNEVVHRIYELCKMVFHGERTRKEVLSVVNKEKVMALGSATIYLGIFNCLMHGNAHKRAMNEYSTKYFLDTIYQDYGRDALKKALQATAGHVTYYNSLKKGRRNSIAKIVDGFTEKFQVSSDLSSIYPDEIDSKNLTEGASKAVTVNVYERNPEARNRCIEHYGLDCAVCDFNFEQCYGELGISFIHVHHLVDIATVGQEYIVNPIKDLRPVCPNCHAMLHKKTPAYSILELKGRLKVLNSNKRKKGA
jgi:5-methylcytosine-specific restriction protein A